METDKKIILFDGHCNLCNGAVNFIMDRDKKDLFRFASLQSDIGEQLTGERGIDTSKIDSIILIEPGKAYYIKAAAALRIGTLFGGFWKVLWLFEQIPSPISNAVYDLIARYRYSWFGRKEHCRLPSPEEVKKFL
jgi:predicted DCC family thiol-disulfide oxidoreductase YuxK